MIELTLEFDKNDFDSFHVMVALPKNFSILFLKLFPTAVFCFNNTFSSLF